MAEHGDYWLKRHTVIAIRPRSPPYYKNDRRGVPKEIIDMAWESQLRLCRRYARLVNRGKHRSIVVTAIAREIIAYIWAISREVVLTPIDPKNHLSRVPAQ